MEAITVEIGQLSGYFRLDFSGHPYSEMLVTMHFVVINAKEQREFQGATRCLCRTSLS